MSNEHQPLNQDSIQRDRLIDSICDTFEKMYFAGERPQIEAFLDRVDGPTKQPLLIELLELEIHIRRIRRETIDIAEYQSRFPGLSAARLEETLRHTLDPSLDHHLTKAPAGELPTLDSGSQPNMTGNLEIVRYFGDYELLNVIAKGGMGIVYKARQISLNRIVALKMIVSGEFASKEAVDRFYSEAKAAALLDHPGIVPIFEVGEYEGKHFFSMPFVEGSCLASQLNDGPLDPLQSARLMQEVALAVQYAHERGVIHRDLKPSNILFDLHGRPRITDFGLAKRLTDQSGLTVSGQVLGTPSYMPPEQAAGQVNTICPASDVYALGAILYSLTTGRPPFHSASSIDTLRQVVEKEPVAPRQLNSVIPRDLETIILKCLEKSLPRRYGSAKLLAEELKRFVVGRPIVARPISRVNKAWRWCQRNPSVATLASLVILLLSSVALISAVSYFREVAFRVKQEKLTLSESKAKEAEHEARLEERQAKEIAKASEALMRRNLYVSDAARIDDLIKEQNFDRAQALLDRHIPKSSNEEDLRGFDWYYHWRQLNQELACYDFMRSVEVMDLSADEKTLAVGCEGGRAYLLNLESGIIRDVAFAIDDEHWASLAFVDKDRLIGHGQLGGFKLWNLDTGDTIASITAGYVDNVGKKLGKVFDHRIPAAISKNGERMVCADSTSQALLALWDPKSMRPSTFPLINDGIHTVNVEGKVSSWEFNFFAPEQSRMIIQSQVPEMEEEFAAGRIKSVDEWFMRRVSDRASRQYERLGIQQEIFLSRERLDLPIGHPVSAISISSDGKLLVAGTKSGELQVWDLKKVEQPTQWTEELSKTCKISETPIVSVAISGDGKKCLITDGKSWQALNNGDFKLLKKVNLSNGLCTAVTFLEDDLIAVGMSYGLIELWSLSESRVIQRFNTSQNAVTRMIFGNLTNHMYASNADGQVFAFERSRETQAITPQTSAAKAVAPQTTAANANFATIATWSECTGCLAYEGSSGLVLLDLRQPAKAVKNAESTGVLSGLRNGIVFRDKQSEIMSIHQFVVEIHDRETLGKIKTLNVFQHKDANGRMHPIQANHHPQQGLIFSDGQFALDPEFENRSAIDAKKSSLFQTISVDMFSDERRLAILAVRDDRIHLIHRDIDSDAILSELRITGIAPRLLISKLTCIDKDRVLISGLSRVGSKNLLTDLLTVVWNTSDGSLRLSEVDAFTEKKPRSADASGKVRDKGLLNVEIISDRGQLGVWDRTMVQVLRCETLESVFKASAPEGDDILFAYFATDGNVFAVLGKFRQEFRWVRWDLQSREWQTIFESKERTYGLWFVDASSQILYNMLELGTFQRWSIATGDHLKQLVVPTGSIEALQVDRSGVVASLLRSTLLAKMERYTKAGPLGSSINWHHKGILIRADRVAGDEEFKNKERYTTEPNNRLNANGIVSRGSHKATVEFEGTEFAREKTPQLSGQNDSLAALSEDQSCFVKIQPDGTLHRWGLDGDAGSESVLNYRYKGSTTIDDFSKAVRLTLAPNGEKIAYATEEIVRWSEQPFNEWHTADLKITPGEKITAIEFSVDHETLAVGFNDGHVALHSMLSGLQRVLGRGHDGAIHDLLWMPDRRTLTTAGNDGAVVVWDIEQEEIRLRLVGHQGAVKSLAIDPTRNILYSGGDDGRIQPWIAAPVESIGRKEPNLVSLNPNAELQERLAPPTPASLHNQKVLDWLGANGAAYRLSKFGILIPEDTEGSPISPTLNRNEEISVHTISLGDNQAVSDADLANLEGLAELRVLDLTNCKISPFGVAKLKRLAGLHTLNLSGINLTGFDFEHLADSPRIQTLKLNNCSISDEQLLSIIRLFPMLRELELSHAHVTNASALKLNALNLLSTLNMDSTHIDDEFLTVIGNLTRLEVLDLSGTKMSGSDLSTIWSSKLLRELRLKGIPVTDAAMDSVARLRMLRTFDVRDTAVTEAGARSFLANRPTVELYVSPEPYGTNPQLEAFLKLGPIRGQVMIDGELKRAWDAIEAIQNGGSITGLTWPVDPRRSSEDIPLLAKLPKLEQIVVSRDAIPKVHLPLLAKISGLRSLELAIYNAVDLNPIPNLEQLRSLTITSLSDEGLARIQKLQSLESLHIKLTSGPTIDKLAKAFPRLRELAFPKIEAESLANAIPFLESLESLTETYIAPKKDVWPILAKLKNLKDLNPRSANSSYIESLQRALPGVRVQAKK